MSSVRRLALPYHVRCLLTLGEFVELLQPAVFGALVHTRPDSFEIGHALRIEWEVLPPEKFFEHLPSLTRGARGAARPVRLRETLQFIASLGPHSWAVGKYLGRRHYVVALFGNVAIAECRLYGNALYCVPLAAWQDVLRRTKTDAKRLGAKKITHHGDWQKRLCRTIGFTAASP